MSKLPFQWGAIQGSIQLPDNVCLRASRLAQDLFLAAEAVEFSGDLVETIGLPKWLPNVSEWMPSTAHLGFLPIDTRAELVWTAGIDPHIDAINGPVLAIALHNDGLRFRQGSASHATTPGEWFLFDDRAKHGVSSRPGRSSYLCLVVPLHAIGRDGAQVHISGN